MNRTEAHQIATAINTARPDWPVASIVTLLARDELRHRPAAHVAIALTAVAYDTDSHTPARVIENGPWWEAATKGTGSPADRSPTAPRAAEQCPTHPGSRATNCAGCRADQLAATPPAYAPPPTPTTARPSILTTRDKQANAWDEGHQANDNTPNPYRRTPHASQSEQGDQMQVGAA